MLNIIIVYVLEALAISVVAYYIPGTVMSWTEIFKITLVGAITHLLLDLYSPLTASGLRFGTGMNIGKNIVSNPVKLFGGEDDCGCEGDADCEEICNMLKGGKNDEKMCMEGCAGDSGCIEGCDKLFGDNNNLTSLPMRLQGGEDISDSIKAICESADTGMDQQECEEMLSEN